jgi:hypothetical protein
MCGTATLEVTQGDDDLADALCWCTVLANTNMPAAAATTLSQGAYQPVEACSSYL